MAFSGFNLDRRVSDIYVMNANGSGLKRIVEGCYSKQCFKRYNDPDWSPDGTKIALAGNEDLLSCGRFAVKSIYTVNADGSGLKRITNQDTNPCADWNETQDYDPDWSPDGNKMVFTRYLGDYGIYTVNADGSGERAIYAPSGNEESEINASDPVWSPNGKRIAFSRLRCVVGAPGFGCYRDVYTVTTDGSGLKRLTDTPATFEADLDWQPLPASEPQSKAACKNGGYKEFGFKNQGRCIAFVNRAAHTQ